MDYRRAAVSIGKRKWIVLLSVIVTTVLVYGITRLMPSRWQAIVRIIAPTNASLAEAINKKLDMSDMDGRSMAAVYSSIVRSQEVLQQASGKAQHKPSLRNLSDDIEVESIGGRMYELHYYDNDPAKARDMANALADCFIAKNRGLNSNEALRTVNLLDSQLKESESRLAILRRKYDKYCLDNQIAGDMATQLNTVLKRLEEARVSKEAAIARIAQLQAQLTRRQNTTVPMTIIQDRTPVSSDKMNRLEKQLGDVEDQLRLLRRRYNDLHPDVKDLIAQKQQLEAELTGERTKLEKVVEPNPAVANSAKSVEELKQLISSDQALIQAEDANILSAQAELNKLRNVNSPIGELASKISAESENRTNLSARLNNSKVALDAAERQNPLMVLEYVGVSNPPTNMSAGRTQKLLLLGALCAFILSAALAIVLDSMDRRPKTVQEAEELLPVRVLAAIPQAHEDTAGTEWARAAELHPLSPQAEAYRFLGQHLLSPQNRHLRYLMAISARPGQGNTRTMTNLAITLAQAGQRVILVDANLRHPDLHNVFALPNQFGLTDALKKPEPDTIEQAIEPTSIANLRVITSGTPCNNPWELFSSNRLAQFSDYLRTRADYLLFDTPNALAYTDTLSLSTVVDGALLCVRAVEPLTGAELRLGDMFALSEMQILGSVLTDAPPSLVGGYHNGARDTSRDAFAPVPALIAADYEPNEVTEQERVPIEPMKNSAFQIDEEPAAAYIPHRDSSHEESVNKSLENSVMKESAEETEENIPLSDTLEATHLPDDPASAGPEEDATAKENDLATANDTPPGGFPKSIHGYSIGAVDDYVRKINSRLESLLMQVQTESSRADESMRVLEQMTSELEAMRRKTADWDKREAETQEARKRADEQYAALQKEFNGERDRARVQLEKALADARQDQVALVTEEREDAETVIAEARRVAAEQVAEAHRQLEQVQRDSEQSQRELELLRRQAADAQHKEASYSELLLSAESQRVRLEAEIEAQRVYARSQIELVVAETRRNAEEAGAVAAAVYREHEERVRALGAECEALVDRIRQAIEAQLSHIPAYPVRAGAASPVAGREESDEKRPRDWRGGDWRSGSDWRNAS